MKKGWKIFWIVCGIMACVGVVCMVAGMAMGATYDAFHNEPGMLQRDNKETFEGIEAIDMDVSLLSVQIVKSEEEKDQIRLETSDIDTRLNFRYEVEGSTLQIETDEQGGLWHQGNVKKLGTVYLYVPEKMLEEVSLEIKAGKIYVEQIQAKQVSLKASIGKIDMLLDGAESDYSYAEKCSMGKVSIGNKSHAGFSVYEGMDKGVGKSLDIECEIGKINVSFTK